jgi:glyceraldehyde 3-phosphate dehydrogenase
MKRIAINGFGRIGRNFLRTIMCDPDAQAQLTVVAINLGNMSLEAAEHLFKYDTL